jgi:hypothetical protein
METSTTFLGIKERRVMKLSLNGLIVAIGGDFEEVLWQLFF